MARRIKQLVEYGSGSDLVYGPRQLFSIVLEQVNLVRTALAIGEGKLPKLPRGIPGDPQHCVIAKALSNGWVPTVCDDEITVRHSTEGIEWEAVKTTLEAYGFQDVTLSSLGRPSRPNKTRRISFRTPAAMSQLIIKFDDHRMPTLVAPSSPKRSVREIPGW